MLICNVPFAKKVLLLSHTTCQNEYLHSNLLEPLAHCRKILDAAMTPLSTDMIKKECTIYVKVRKKSRFIYDPVDAAKDSRGGVVRRIQS